jgi:hypothetical protein
MSNGSVSFTVYLATSLKAIAHPLAGVRIAVFDLLVVSLASSGFAAKCAIPAIIFPHSRLLVYISVFWPCLASTAAFLAAVMSTVLVVGISSVVGELGEAVNVKVERGTSVLLFVWLTWLFVWLSAVYWSVIWFVELRRLSFVRRKRGDDEMGKWGAL